MPRQISFSLRNVDGDTYTWELMFVVRGPRYKLLPHLRKWGRYDRKDLGVGYVRLGTPCILEALRIKRVCQRYADRFGKTPNLCADWIQKGGVLV